MPFILSLSVVQYKYQCKAVPFSSLDSAHAAKQAPHLPPLPNPAPKSCPDPFAYVLDKHTRILTQSLRQRVLTKVTAGEVEVMEVEKELEVAGDSNNNLYSCSAGGPRSRAKRNYYHLMLTRVSQQQTKCPISVQILKVLLCNFH